MEVVPDRRAARAGDGFSLALLARDLSGAAVNAVVAQWTSSNSAVATVDGSGHVTTTGTGTVVVTAQAGGQTATATLYIGPAMFDLVNLVPPHFVVADHHNLANIFRISRFRSGIGHSNGNETIETCRNLKHYFEPLSSLNWTMVPISAPVDGTVIALPVDGLYGKQVHIIPRDFTAGRIILYHVAPDNTIVVGTWLTAGQPIGTHSSGSTLSDIGVFINSPIGDRPVSLFDVLSDAGFAHYQARGVATREAMIITKAERDADPIACVPDQPFPSPGHIENWVYLR